jgi:hypothetical protein
MRDEDADAWAAVDELTRRLLALEEIVERMCPTCADPIAVSDYWLWKAGT